MAAARSLAKETTQRTMAAARSLAKETTQRTTAAASRSLSRERYSIEKVETHPKDMNQLLIALLCINLAHVNLCKEGVTWTLDYAIQEMFDGLLDVNRIKYRVDDPATCPTLCIFDNQRMYKCTLKRL
jgi:hypothetical protein